VTRVLVVDDEPEITRTLAINLKAGGYEVVTAGNGVSALRAAAEHPPEFVILDLGLPDLDGVEVVRGLRGWTTVPILILSGRSGSVDKVEALDAGADDYLTKPFGMDELLARLRALGRRSAGGTDVPAVELGEVKVDLGSRRVTRRDGRAEEDVHLTGTEWLILEALLRHPGKLVSRRQLLTSVWGVDYPQDTNYLRVYITRLRRKLEADPARPRYLINEHGMGYRYQP